MTVSEESPVNHWVHIPLSTCKSKAEYLEGIPRVLITSREGPCCEDPAQVFMPQVDAASFLSLKTHSEYFQAPPSFNLCVSILGKASGPPFTVSFSYHNPEDDEDLGEHDFTVLNVAGIPSSEGAHCFQNLPTISTEDTYTVKVFQEGEEARGACSIFEYKKPDMSLENQGVVSAFTLQDAAAASVTAAAISKVSLTILNECGQDLEARLDLT